MKKVIASALLCLSMSAQASAVYDGIYQLASGNQAWLSVQTNGSSAVATYYYVVPSSNVVFSSSIGSVQPSQANLWDLLLGSWDGNRLNLSGQMVYNACAVNATAVFTGSSATVTINAAQNTATGNRSGVNCGTVNNQVIQFNKIF